ncbi:MAG: bifunctional phosphopantothenoylcysteine decarboxylase/phosphopantothenate--cysteine ligase CoaBC, partial [Caulobacteraceae bacterium]
ADLILVAPATADLMARAAAGFADDLATAVLLASDKPVLMAPAMNVRMWRHPATCRNLARLRADGVFFVGPDEGEMACGEYGEGRMAAPEAILEAAKSALAARREGGALAGLRALVTAGPTLEALDPVRVLTNRSSGKQGYAVATALAALGAEVTLVSGPTSLAAPPGVTRLEVESAEEMLAACRSALPADLAVCVAAVADWRAAKIAGAKIKKAAGGPPTLELVETVDILAALSAPGPGRPRLVAGFAAETGDLEAKARAKLAAKGCDLLIANEVGSGKVFGAEENEVLVLVRDQRARRWGPAGKREIAERLAGLLAEMLGP